MVNISGFMIFLTSLSKNVESFMFLISLGNSDHSLGAWYVIDLKKRSELGLSNRGGRAKKKRVRGRLGSVLSPRSWASILAYTSLIILFKIDWILNAVECWKCFALVRLLAYGLDVSLCGSKLKKQCLRSIKVLLHDPNIWNAELRLNKWCFSK